MCEFLINNENVNIKNVLEIFCKKHKREYLILMKIKLYMKDLQII